MSAEHLVWNWSASNRTYVRGNPQLIAASARVVSVNPLARHTSVDDIGSGIALSRLQIRFRYQATAGKHGSNSLVLAPPRPPLETNLGGAPKKKGRGVTLLATQCSRL